MKQSQYLAMTAIKKRLEVLSFLLIVLVLFAALTQGSGLLPDTQILLTVLTFALLIFFLTLNQPIKLLAPHYSFLFLLAFLLLAASFSIWLTNSILTVLLICAYFFIFWLASSTCKLVKLASILSFLILGGTVVSSWAIFNNFITVSNSAFANFSNANSLAGFLGLIIPLIIGLLFSGVKEVAKFWLTLALIVNVTAFYLTFSYGGFLALSLGLILMVVLAMTMRLTSKTKTQLSFAVKDSRSHYFRLWLTKLTFLVIFIFLAYQFGLFTYFSSAFAFSRFELWQAALKMIASRPIFGFGPGSFATALPLFQVGSVYSLFAHNSYLQFAAENGFLALVILLFTFYLVLKLAWQNLLSTFGSQKYVKIGLLGALVSFMAHNFVDYTWYVPATSLLFWLLAGFAVAPDFSQQDSSDSLATGLSMTDKELIKTVSQLSFKRLFIIVFFTLTLIPLVFAYIGASLELQADIKLRAFSYSEGRRLAKLAVKFFPYNAEAYATLAKAYAEPVNPKKYIRLAVAAQKKAIKLRPTWPHYYTILADYLALAGAPAKEVWLNYKKAVKLYPLEPQLKVKAGNQLLKVGQYKKAITFYQQTVNLSQIYQASKQTAKTLKNARVDVAIPIRTIGLAHLGLAKSYAYLKEFKKAQYNLKKGAKILGQAPGVIFTDGLIKEKQKNYKLAAKLYQQASKKSLFYLPEINYRLAIVWLKLGEKEKSLEQLKIVVKTDAHFQPAKALLKKLKAAKYGS